MLIRSVQFHVFYGSGSHRMHILSFRR